MAQSVRPAYWSVFTQVLRNSLVRDMSFRSNFIIEAIASTSWIAMNLGFYLLIFRYTMEIGDGTGWGKYEFFVFLATTMFVNSLIQAFFMPNAQEFSEMIRTGGLDFALLKPIDTQFLISTQKVAWSSLANTAVGVGLLLFSVWKLASTPTAAISGEPLQLTWWAVLLYPFYVFCGVMILYGVMISLSATSIWLGRNQSLYNFWFYITNFSRYPMEIYNGTFGTPLKNFFTFVIPVLVVVNVPARIMAQPLCASEPGAWRLPVFAVFATIVSLVASRWVFLKALGSYRSASS